MSASEPSRIRRRLLWLVPIAGLALVAVVATSSGADAERWTEVALRSLSHEVEIEGELRAVRSLDLGPPPLRDLWNFKLSFLAPEGSSVEAGQPVLGFDTSELQPKLLQALAERDRAAKALEKSATDFAASRQAETLALSEAEANVRKSVLKTSVPEDIVASRELAEARLDRQLAEREIEFRRLQLQQLDKRARAEVAGLRRQYEQAVARVDQIEDSIERMTVLAPSSGTVVYKTGWRGDKKKPGDSVWRQEIVLQIPDLSEMEVVGEVLEADSGRIALGQHARLRLDAHPEEIFDAKLTTIRPTVQQRSWRDPRKVVKVVLALDRTDAGRMRPGMRIKGKVVIGNDQEVLMIPLDAVNQDDLGPRVAVKTAFGRRLVRPELGERSGDWVVVRSGLEVGDRVARFP